MDEHSRAVAVRMIERQITLQATSDYPEQQFGHGVIELAYELNLISDKQHAEYIKLQSSIVADRQKVIRTQLRDQRLAAPRKTA